MDSGVVAGLSVGLMSICWIFLQSLYSGHAPDVDPCLPAVSSNACSSNACSSNSSRNDVIHDTKRL